MCLQVAQVGLSILGNALGQQAQSDAQTRAYLNNAQTANNTASEQYAQNYLKQLQEEAKATQERIQTSIERRKATGTAVASSENSGQAMYNVLNDISRQAAQRKNVIDVNQRNAKAQTIADNINIRDTNINRINSVSPGNGVDPTSLAISGLGAYLGSKVGSGTANSKDIAINSAAASDLFPDTNTHRAIEYASSGGKY